MGQRWRGSSIGRALDFAIICRGFKSNSRQRCVTTLGKLFTHTVCASVSKQYNLVPAKGRWCFAAGEVTAGLAESNGSLPPGGWLTVTCGLTACTLGSAPSPTLGIEYGKAFTFTFTMGQLFTTEPNPTHQMLFDPTQPTTVDTIIPLWIGVNMAAILGGKIFFGWILKGMFWKPVEGNLH